jgi:hypothetical protein
MATPYQPKSKEALFLQQLSLKVGGENWNKSLNPQVILLSQTFKTAIKVLDASEEARKKMREVLDFIKENWK